MKRVLFGLILIVGTQGQSAEIEHVLYSATIKLCTATNMALEAVQKQDQIADSENFQLWTKTLDFLGSSGAATANIPLQGPQTLKLKNRTVTIVGKEFTKVDLTVPGATNKPDSIELAQGSYGMEMSATLVGLCPYLKGISDPTREQIKQAMQKLLTDTLM